MNEKKKNERKGVSRLKKGRIGREEEERKNKRAGERGKEE